MKQELIWELMKQAGELAYEEHKAKCLEEGLDPERTVWSVTGATYEKFAELIVKECAAQCNHNDDMDRILEHFGVES
jgi:hypothetical protein